MANNGATASMEEVIAKILAKRSELNRKQLLELVEQKKKDYKGWITDEGAVRLVAEELEVEAFPGSTPVLKLEVKKLVGGLNDVTLTGTVVSSDPAKEFPRKDKSTGRLLKVVLSDHSGQISCAFWDEKADELLKQGELSGRQLTVKHGYTRASRGGEVELNAGARSEISIAAVSGVPGKTQQAKTAKMTMISEIKPPMIELNLLGVVQSKPRIYEFERNGKKGAVFRVIIADKTGNISLAAWNERANELRGVNQGDVLDIRNGKLRRDNAGRTEIHLDTRSAVTRLEKPPKGFEVPEIRDLKIAELKTHTRNISLMAAVIGTSEPQLVQRKSGEAVSIARMIVGDETGLLAVSMWDDKAALALQLKPGDVVRIEGATASTRLGQSVLSVGRTGTLRKMEEADKLKVKVSKVAEAMTQHDALTLEGEISEAPEMRDVTTRKGEQVQVTTLLIRDTTGEARVSLWRTLAIEAAKLTPGTRIRIHGLLPRPGMEGNTEFTTIQGAVLEAAPEHKEEVKIERLKSSEKRGSKA